MAKAFVLKQYFIHYLKNKVSERTVKHYLSGIDVISEHLKEHGVIEGEIYEILDFTALQIIHENLRKDKDFADKDNRGHRMYSAALNHYFKFIQGVDLLSMTGQWDMDIPINRGELREVRNVTYGRSSIIKRQALSMAHYTCELNAEHITFINRFTKQPYMEGHHIIMMKHQNEFKYSLDVYANIICICPNCHRLLHLGVKDEQVNCLKIIYDSRKIRLEKSGLKIGKNDFIDLALELD
jgi:5-methylcytosine-specific restriction protein A